MVAAAPITAAHAAWIRSWLTEPAPLVCTCDEFPHLPCAACDYLLDDVEDDDE